MYRPLLRTGFGDERMDWFSSLLVDKTYHRFIAHHLGVTEYMNSLIERIIAAILLCIFMPLLIVFALSVWITMGAPVLFKQQRAGLYEKPFLMVKFRTMRKVSYSDGVILPDEERLTKFGKFLRASSLDELPELWNVLTGNISLVGPRPLLMEYLPFYSKEQARRHEVKPGITGWAQVNGRNGLSWEEKFKMDIWYVDNRSLWLDLKILFLTMGKVITREGVSPRNSEIMPRFNKNKS
jgi:lipopolysaccharide/colanic/teichoic acid biosynthesis glycosyltransferase